MQYGLVSFLALVFSVLPFQLDASSLLPHFEHVGDGIHVAGFADRYRSANCGWIALEDETLLVDLPRGVKIPEFLTEVNATTSKPVRTLVVTRFEKGDAELVAALIVRGLARVYASTKVRAALVAGSKPAVIERIHSVNASTSLGDCLLYTSPSPRD